MIKKLILPVLALLAITACSSDELLQESPNGGEPLMHFNGLVGNNTRAEVGKSTLEGSGFWVNAFYTSDNDNAYYFTGNKLPTGKSTHEWASKKEDGSFYPKNDYYWPGKPLTFVAWYDGQNGGEPNTYGKINCNQSEIKFDRTFDKSDVTANCVDFVYAFEEDVNHQSSYSDALQFNFNHAFSQILVQANKSADCDYDVKVKGVSIRYVMAIGSFIIEPKNPENSTIELKADWTLNSKAQSKHIKLESYTTTATDNQTINADENNGTNTNCWGNYKKEYVLNPIELTTTPQALNGTKKSEGGFELKDGFYIIPQEFTEEFNGEKLMSSQAWSGELNTAETKHYGAYLALDVELTKDGKEIRNGKVAVPVFTKLTKLEQGNRYIINLTFSKGAAGQVPPDDPGDEEMGGEPILGLPIHFSVEETGWTEVTYNGTWIKDDNGDQSFNASEATE